MLARHFEGKPQVSFPLDIIIFRRDAMQDGGEHYLYTITVVLTVVSLLFDF